MKPPHAHTWTLINSTLHRYRCADCGVIGHHRTGRRGIVPYECQFELGARGGDRTHCKQPATHVTGVRTQSRCALHHQIEAVS